MAPMGKIQNFYKLS